MQGLGSGKMAMKRSADLNAMRSEMESHSVSYGGYFISFHLCVRVSCLVRSSLPPFEQGGALRVSLLECDGNANS